MTNLLFVSPTGGHEQVRAILRQIIAFPSLSDPSFVAPQGESFALATTRGRTRKRNEDRATVVRVSDSSGDRPWLLAAVCDGMGGMTDGASAAEIALSTFVATVLGGRSGITDQSLASAARAANQAVYSEFRGGGGATLSAVGWNSSRLVTVNSGDSRIWALDKLKRYTQWTRDDTIAAQLEAQGEAAEDARRDLVQFVGIGDEFSPHVEIRDAADADSIAITSDGAHSTPILVTGDVLRHSDNPLEMVTRLVNLSLWIGGQDNATAVSLTLGPVVGTIPGTVEVWTPAGSWRVVRPPNVVMPERMPGAPVAEPHVGAIPQFDTSRAQHAAEYPRGNHESTRKHSPNPKSKKRPSEASLFDERGQPISQPRKNPPAARPARVQVIFSHEDEVESSKDGLAIPPPDAIEGGANIATDGRTSDANTVERAVIDSLPAEVESPNASPSKTSSGRNVQGAEE